jgi:predicted acyl esterase
MVAHFQGPELQEPLRFSGSAHLELTLSVSPGGYSHLVAGLYQIHNHTWSQLSMGGRGLAQRNGADHDEPPAAGESLDVPIDFTPCDVFLDKGDQLALTLSGDGTGFQPNGNYPTFKVQYGGTLTLPTLPPGTPRGLPTPDAIRANPFNATAPLHSTR